MKFDQIFWLRVVECISCSFCDKGPVLSVPFDTRLPAALKIVGLFMYPLTRERMLSRIPRTWTG